jgi:hypothetical protein
MWQWWMWFLFRQTPLLWHLPFRASDYGGHDGGWLVVSCDSISIWSSQRKDRIGFLLSSQPGASQGVNKRIELVGHRGPNRLNKYAWKYEVPHEVDRCVCLCHNVPYIVRLANLENFDCYLLLPSCNLTVIVILVITTMDLMWPVCLTDLLFCFS